MNGPQLEARQEPAARRPSDDSSWWEAFFDDDYPFLYAAALDPVRTEHEVAALAALLKLPASARLLDLCCGEGRHAVPLQRRGACVTGVDVSVALLRRAQQRAARIFGQGRGPAWVRADARALPLRPIFDACTLLFNSIGYGTDQDTLAMLRAARGVLKRHGQLVLECVHRDAHQSGPLERDWTELAGVRVLTERSFEPVSGVQRATFSFLREGREVVKELRHRLYTATEIARLLAEADFGSFELYGGWDKRPFQVNSGLLIAHARAG